MHLSAKYGMKKGDFILIILVLALAGATLLPFIRAPHRMLTCEIVQDGQTVTRVQLGAGYRDTITLHAGDMANTIIIGEDAVWFSASTCPDQVCVRTGSLTRAGQVAVCLPTRVVVRLVGAQHDIDAMVT